MTDPDPALRQVLIDRARELAARRGWSWREPPKITAGMDPGDGVWVVRSNAGERSPSVRVFFRRSDLGVVHAGYLPR